MSTVDILAAIRKEIAALQKAEGALAALTTTGFTPTPQLAKALAANGTPETPKRGGMTAEVRARLSEKQKARWEKIRADKARAEKAAARAAKKAGGPHKPSAKKASSKKAASVKRTASAKKAVKVASETVSQT
jgi:hypothetical protein